MNVAQKTLFATTAVLSLVMGLIGYIDYSMEVRRAQDSLSSRLDAITNRLVPLARDMIWAVEVEKLENPLLAEMVDPDVKSIVVYEIKKDQAFLAKAVVRTDSGQLEATKTEPARGDVSRDVPVFQADRKIGQLKVNFSYLRLKQQLRELAWHSLAKAIFLLIALSAVLGVLMKKTMITPVRNAISVLEAEFIALLNSAQNISKSSSELSASAEEQISLLVKSVSSLHDVVDKIQQSNLSIAHAHELSTVTASSARTSAEKVRNLTSAMGDIARVVTGIAEISAEVQGIAYQTNLLALNSAVEAARVGDFGKSFGVLAEEVRNLAKRTSDAVSQSAKRTKDAVMASKSGGEIGQAAASDFNEIAQKFNQVEVMMEEIRTIAGDQQAQLQALRENIDRVEEFTNRTSVCARKGEQEARSMEEEAFSLERTIGSLSALVGIRRD